MIKTNIIVKLQVEGFHNWPAAKDILPEVAFLSDRHRHIFFIECKKEVSHSDRDVEIIMFKRSILEYLLQAHGNHTHGNRPYYLLCEFGAMSCEMIAEELIKEFNLEYCSVLEDNENGAECYAEPMMYSSDRGAVQ